MNLICHFPSPLLAWAMWDCTHDELIVLLDPSTTCLLPVYTPFLLWQHRGVDSWDSAPHWDTPWLAPPYVLFPWMAGPVGSAWSQWVCPLLFQEWHSWLRFVPCRARAGYTVTGLWDPDHSLWRWISHFDTVGTDDVVQCLLKPWLLTRTVLLAPEFWWIDLRLSDYFYFYSDWNFLLWFVFHCYCLSQIFIVSHLLYFCPVYLHVVCCVNICHKFCFPFVYLETSL